MVVGFYFMTKHVDVWRDSQQLIRGKKGAFLRCGANRSGLLRLEAFGRK